MTTLRKAARQKAKIRLGLSAVSGGGKTMSALLIARGLCDDWSEIALIDTENGSGDLYAHLGDYNILPLQAPYTPENYIKAIKDCENTEGIKVVIIDSISHEWDGKGGCLEILDSMGGKFQDWAKVTPRHQAFIDSILQCKCHVITTVRRKQDYQMIQDGNKTKVEKAGLREVTREGFEYEVTINLELDIRHNATASKDRTGMFMDKPGFIPSQQTGAMILDWCESGLDIRVEITDAINKLSLCNSTDELTMLKDGLPIYVTDSAEFKKAGLDRYNKINPKIQQQTA